MPEPLDVAAAAVDALPCPGQALVVAPLGEAPRIELTAVVDGRAETAVARSAGPEDLARAAKQAAVRARQMRALPAPPLPEPAAVDAAAHVEPGAPDLAAAGPDVKVEWASGVVTIAVASSTGVRVAETRSWATLTASATAADGRTAVVRRAGEAFAERPGAADATNSDRAAVPGASEAEAQRAAGPGAPAAASVRPAASVADAAAEVRALLGAGPSLEPLVVAVPALRVDVPAGPLGAVLGPEAVATVLDAVRAGFGVDAAFGPSRNGRRVAAAGIDLADDSGQPGMLGRAFDVEGVPRRRVELLRDGVVMGAVRDCAAAARVQGESTGHATRPLTLAPMPEHLVLGGGDAADAGALCAALGDGIHLAALVATGDEGEHGGRVYTAPGAAAVVGGRPVGAVVDLQVEVDPAAVLAAVTARTAVRRLVALRPHAPGGTGAALVPALLATAGVWVQR